MRVALYSRRLLLRCLDLSLRHLGWPTTGGSLDTLSFDPPATRYSSADLRRLAPDGWRSAPSRIDFAHFGTRCNALRSPGAGESTR